MEHAIVTQGLTMDFGSLRALDGLSLRVPRGTVFGFLGPNGAGKTTTIRLLLGLLQPTSGRATVLGHDVTSEGGEARACCGALLEHNGLYERLSPAENLEFYARAYRLPPAERRARVDELLERFGFVDRRDEPVGRWSRGMRQKLAVARVLIHRPALLFLDEPTAGLDAVAGAALRQEIAALAGQEGVTVFLTTHNLSEAEKLCDQVAVIHRGRTIAVGPPQQLRRQEGARLRVRSTTLGDEVVRAVQQLGGVQAVETREDGVDVLLGPQGAAPALVRTLVALGVEVEEVRREDPTLEESFLALLEGEA